MNSTNRALNRVGIFLLGLLLLVGGTAVATAASIPGWLERWAALAAVVDASASDLLERTTASGADRSWLLLALPAVCLVLIVLLAFFTFRQGLGRTRALVTEKSGPSSTTSTPAAAGPGTITIDGKVAEHSLREALDVHPGLLSSSVSTFLVKRTPTLRITANTRRGVSPHDVRAYIDEVVAAWDGVLGREVPIVIQITSGLAARSAKAARFDAEVREPGANPATLASGASAPQPPRRR